MAKSIEHQPLPAQAPQDSAHSVDAGKDPMYNNPVEGQNFARGVQGVADSRRWGPSSVPHNPGKHY